MTRSGGGVAIDARIAGHVHRLGVKDGFAEYLSDVLRVTLQASRWTVVDARAERNAAEGDVLDLGTCALLIALLHAEPALPPHSNVQADAIGI